VNRSIRKDIRIGAWVLIVALAAFQTYGNRYAISPDGMSYLDLSDAVVTGRWGDLVNLYWSPLYPFLIGVARRIADAGAEHEVAIVHAVNLAAFLAMFAGFEYFIVKVLSIAAGVRHAMLRGPWGAVAAYGLFGALSMTMTPLELTTPDWLSNAAVFIAMGAMLRLRDEPDDRRTALLLGAALGVGALAKSFLVPWSIVCFVVLAIALHRAASHRAARRPLTLAILAWAVFVLPWTAVLTHRAGRVTFGDTGRLTWGWYVNGQDPPSLGVVPPDARTRATEAILPGTGVTGDAPGTDPMWYDPARWNASMHPRLSLHDELGTLATMSVTLIGSLSILLYLGLAIAVAPRGSRRVYLARSWIVLVPCLIGILGYAMVIMTARYIMAFVLSGVLVTLGTLPIARRLRPTWLLLGLVISISPLAPWQMMSYAFSFATGIAAAMLVGALIPTRRAILWMVLVPLALLFSLLLFSPATQAVMRLGSAAIIVLLWAASRAAIRRWRMEQFARGALTGLAVGAGLVLAGRLALRANRDAINMSHASAAVSANPQWQIAQELAAHGIAPGTRIALIGPHAESYWARTARLKIVADVPGPIVPVWWMLTPASRDALLAQFAADGATVAIAVRAPDNVPPDSTWTPLKYGGWMRRLK